MGINKKYKVISPILGSDRPYGIGETYEADDRNAEILIGAGVLSPIEDEDTLVTQPIKRKPKKKKEVIGDRASDGNPESDLGATEATGSGILAEGVQP